MHPELFLFFDEKTIVSGLRGVLSHELSESTMRRATRVMTHLQSTRECLRPNTETSSSIRGLQNEGFIESTMIFYHFTRYFEICVILFHKIRWDAITRRSFMKTKHAIASCGIFPLGGEFLMGASFLEEQPPAPGSLRQRSDLYELRLLVCWVCPRWCLCLSLGEFISGPHSG